MIFFILRQKTTFLHKDTMVAKITFREYSSFPSKFLTVIIEVNYFHLFY